MKALKRKDILYPELSYQIIGILFDVYNKLGSGYQEKYYQKTISSAFKKTGLLFKEQVPMTLNFEAGESAKALADFIVENKIILEIKKGERFF